MVASPVDLVASVCPLHADQEKRATRGMSGRSRHDSHMPNATSLTAALQPLLPLRIQHVEFADRTTLTVMGDGWSLNLLGDWTWSRGELVVTDADQPDAEDAVWDLCGLDLVGLHFPDPAFDGDCSFNLSDGSLEVRSDRSGWETWTYRHEDLDVVYVGL